VALQPNISVRGWPTDAGSHALAGFSALEDATVVRRLREGGASVVGSTHMSEFGLGLEGSQAGAAVRDGLAGVELVLDLAGEARLAAARAGVCALKPSYGLVSRFGLVGLIPSMEACAILADDPRSIGKALAQIAGPDELDFSLPGDAAADLSPQTIDPTATSVGVIAEALAGLPAERAEGFRVSLEAFSARGIAVREVSLPDFSLFSLVHQIVGSVEASSCAGRYDSVRYGPRAAGAKNWNEMYLSSREAAFGTPLKSYLLQGTFFQFERYEAFEDACRIRARLVREMSRLTAEVEFLALPLGDALPSPADPYAGSALTLCANVTGQPALYLPPGPGDRQEGLQLLGPRLSDGRLLALAGLLLDADTVGGE
jgi:aspartyl-tRNA(Asn)/glutamyl-tRNA(Gln) amidotransferase subunit A